MDDRCNDPGSFNFTDWLRSGGDQTLKKFALGASYQRVSWVYACINLIANSIAGVPVKFSREITGQPPVELDNPSDPVNILFRPPSNPDINSIRDLLFRTFVHLGISGGVFWLFKKSSARLEVFDRIEIRRVHQIKAIYADDANTELIGWVEVDRHGRPVESFLVNQVVPFLYYNPQDPTAALSPLSAARVTVEGEFNMNAWNSSFFKSGLRNPISISSKGGLTTPQRDDIRKEVNNYYSGIGGAQGALILKGNVEVKDLGVSTKDLDFINGKKLNREEICSVFGVPPALVGIFEFANYANSREQRMILWENTLMPRIQFIMETVQSAILDVFFPDVKMKFDLSMIKALRPDPVELAPAVTAYFELGYNREEVANILDIPELAESIESEEAPVDSSDEETEPQEILSGLPGICRGRDRVESLLEKTSSCRKDPFPILFTPEETKQLDWQDQYAEAHVSALIQEENNVIKGVRKFFTLAEKTLLRKRQNNDAVMLSEVLWVDTWVELVNPAIEEVMIFSGEVGVLELSTAGRKGFGDTKQINLPDFLTGQELDAFLDAINTYTSRVTNISQSLISKLNADLAQRLTGGETIAQARRSIRDLIGETFRGRALTIARTVTNGAYNAARNQLFLSKNVKTIQWINAGDSFVRSSHVSEGGNSVALGDPFPVTQLRYPHDPAGPAAEVINCVIEDTELGGADVDKLYRRKYSGEVVTLQTESRKELTVTPNHPILTLSGWVAASEIKKGCDIFSASLSDVSGVTFLNVQHPVSAADKIFDSFSSVGEICRVSGTDMDFHGDGKESDIDIIRADSKLWNWLITQFREVSTKLNFSGTNFIESYLLVFSTLSKAFVSIFGSSPSSLGIFRKFCFLCYGQLRHSNQVSLRSGSESHLEFFQSGQYASSSDIIFLGQCENGHPIDVVFFDALFVKVLSQASEFESGRSEFPGNGTLITPEQVGNFRAAIPFSVKLDKIVGVKFDSFNGHVYNLENSGKYPVYTANGIITSNCRCTVTASSIQVIENNIPPQRPKPVSPVGNLTGQSDATFLKSLGRILGGITAGLRKKTKQDSLLARGESLDLDSIRSTVNTVIDGQKEAWDTISADLGKRAAVPVSKALNVRSNFLKSGLNNAGRTNLVDYLYRNLPTRLRNSAVPVSISGLSNVRRAFYDRKTNSIKLPKRYTTLLSEFFNDPAAYTGRALNRIEAESMLTALTAMSHEFGHHVHFGDARLQDWTRTLFRKRTAKDELSFVGDTRDELGKRDQWARSYQGRIYDFESQNNPLGTEVFSMFNETNALLPWNTDLIKLIRSNETLNAIYESKIASGWLGDKKGFLDHINELFDNG